MGNKETNGIDVNQDGYVEPPQNTEGKDKKSGFFDLPHQNTCKDLGHKPPTHIHIPQGKGYRHVCPKCGKITDLIPQQITL